MMGSAAANTALGNTYQLAIRLRVLEQTVQALTALPTVSDTVKLELMEVVLRGCKTHPSYRARKKHITSCSRCGRMWNSAEVLRQAGIL